VRRFEFRLDRVLKVKQQRERLAELRQHQARAAVEAAEARRAAFQEQLQRVATALAGQMGQTVDASFWMAHYRRSAQLTDALRTAEVQIQQATQKWQDACAERTRIATEVEALLYLRRQQWETYSREAQREHQERLDEVGLRGWLNRQATKASELSEGRPSP
jgi:flagellar biosynthesis chaperone FliJ